MQYCFYLLIMLRRFSEVHSKTLSLAEGGRVAVRVRDAQQGVAFSASPLALDELFEISILSLTTHLAGTLCFGVTTAIPNNTDNVFATDSCYLTGTLIQTQLDDYHKVLFTGNELHYKTKVIQHFAPSFNWLRIGDRVGLLRTHEGGLKAFINGEELPLSFPNFPEMVYVVADLKGTCSSLSVTSRKTLPSPLTNVPLQDSLEIVLEQEQSTSEAPIASEEIVSLVESSEPIKYEFHENHGRNIEICGGERVVAKRVASYNQGLVLLQPALQLNRMVQVVVDGLNPRWQSSLTVGIVCGSPEKINLPVTALGIKGTSCIVTNDWISVNGAKVLQIFLRNIK